MSGRPRRGAARFGPLGTTSIYASSRFERCFRDVHVATQHIAVALSNIEMAG
jgi:hypothetical protein